VRETDAKRRAHHALPTLSVGRADMRFRDKGDRYALVDDTNPANAPEDHRVDRAGILVLHPLVDALQNRERAAATARERVEATRGPHCALTNTDVEHAERSVLDREREGKRERRGVVEGGALDVMARVLVGRGRSERPGQNVRVERDRWCTSAHAHAGKEGRTRPDNARVVDHELDGLRPARGVARLAGLAHDNPVCRGALRIYPGLCRQGKPVRREELGPRKSGTPRLTKDECTNL
jgi:hypothetical protein